MGTKIHTNTFLREYHSVIDLDASTSNAMRSPYNENGILQNGKNPYSISSYDIEKVRHTILEHESIFRNQLRELHRLYGRQRDLMNEIKRRGIINKDDVMEDKFQLGYFLSPFPTENAKRSWNSSNNSISRGGTYSLGFQADLYPKFPIVESTSEKRNHATTAFDGDDKSLCAAQTPQHGTDALTISLCNRNSYRGDMSMTMNPTNGVTDRLTLSRAEISANSWSNLGLVTKDFFHDSLDRMNKEGSLSIQGLRNERSGKEHLSDDYKAEKRRIDKHTSLGEFRSGKSAAFPQSLLAEPRNEFPNSPLDIGTSLSRKKKKIFGVEISQGNDDDAFDSTSNMSSNLDWRAGPHEQNHRTPTLQPSSLFADSFNQNLSLVHGANQNDGKNEWSKADLKGEISCHSGTNEKWLDDDLRKDFKNVVNANMAAPILKKDPESQSNQENPKGSLPWFLRDSQVSSGLNNGVKSSYFMNLDSLQSCSLKFFAKVEMPTASLQNSKQKKEVKGEINEVNCSGIGDDFAPRVDVNETKDLVLDKGLNFISGLRHCIDLNLSLDEEDAPSAPSLPSAIVKIATTEIDLEPPAAIESDVDALDLRKSDMPPPYEECDKFAAEALIAISSCVEQKLDDDEDDSSSSSSFTSLKWFAEVISSERHDAAVVVEDEESIPADMDYFEYTTLKLEDTKEEHHFYEPFVLKDLSDDEAGAVLARRTRRGQSRRGRQRRDFQRDILPGLVTLSRLQVSEDFQAFEELLRAGGGTWESHRGSTRNGRGRKRLGGATTSPTVKTPCSTQAEQPACQIEERSLAGWGKKTRRLPRQRCPNALLSFPVKC